LYHIILDRFICKP